MLQANSDIGIAACAGTLVIVAGGIDLSVGAIYGLAGVISAKLAISTGVGAGIVGRTHAGAAVGLLNGLVVTTGGVNPLIATLAGSIVFSGAAEVVAGQECDARGRLLRRSRPRLRARRQVQRLALRDRRDRLRDPSLPSALRP